MSSRPHGDDSQSETGTLRRMRRLNGHLRRRTLLTGVGIAAGLTALTGETRATAAEDDGGGSDMETITVSGAVRGVPYALATGSLDQLEYARRASINSRVFRQAWTKALDRLRTISFMQTSPSSGLESVSEPIAGVILKVPPGFYPIDSWDLSVTAADLHLSAPEGDAGGQFGEWSVRIVIEADGAVLVAKDYAGSGSEGTPVVYLGSPDSAGLSRDLLKRVTIRGLSIQSDVNALQAFTSSDRIGMLVHEAQEITLERVSIFGFRREGLRLEGVMDSTFLGVNIGWCARASDSASQTYALALISKRDSEGRLRENCNALRFIGCHLEFCTLELFLDRGTRHIDFLGSKFEHGWGTVSAASPVQIGLPGPAPAPVGRVGEISFTSCMFVQNTYAHEGTHPTHIRIEEGGYVGSQSEKAKTSVSFNSCHFTVPDGGGERWFAGSDATFLSCDFNGCGNADGEPACFDLGDDVTLSVCRFSVARTIHDGVAGDQGGIGSPLQHARADLFRFRGGASRILDPVIYFPARTDDADAVPGSLATLGLGVGNGNRISGWHPHWYGLPTSVNGEPTHIETVRYEQVDRVQLLSALSIEPWSQEVSVALTPDVNGGVSVAGRATIKLSSEGRFSNFTDGYSGQVVRVVSDGGSVSLVTGHVVLHPSSASAIEAGQMRSFMLYTDGVGAAWFEV